MARVAFKPRAITMCIVSVFAVRVKLTTAISELREDRHVCKYMKLVRLREKRVYYGMKLGGLSHGSPRTGEATSNLDSQAGKKKPEICEAPQPWQRECEQQTRS
jgi:hypothetical protein